MTKQITRLHCALYSYSHPLSPLVAECNGGVWLPGAPGCVNEHSVQGAEACARGPHTEQLGPAGQEVCRHCLVCRQLPCV